MRSLILLTASRYLLPLLLLFSVFILQRGHNEPGGGFVGGLVAAAAFVLYSLAYGVPAARVLLRLDPHATIGLGLLLVVGSGAVGAVLGQPFLTGVWTEVTLPFLGHLEVGTPVLFDLGVFLAVFGVTLMIMFALEEEE
ncbi:MAG: Na+/H+ antiporter subunit B [Anaerolineae bacterium]|nr:Na+/H+ antiporter subunit B [Anaerolineae bacterium]